MKKVIILLVLLFILVSQVSSERLPNNGSDDEVWGSILLGFLNVSLAENGTVRGNSINSSQILNGSIKSGDLADNSVNSSHIMNGTIKQGDLGSNSVNSTHIVNGIINVAAKITDGIITSAKLVSGIITANYLSPSAVNTTHILDATILTEDIASAAITSTKISPSSVNDTHLTSGSVTLNKIVPNSVNTTQIIDGTLTGDDISTNTNLTIDTLNATKIDLELTEIEAECNTALCTATAACPAGKKVIFGLSADNSLLCDLIPLNCNEYCNFGDASCSTTAVVSSASVKVVCAKIS